MPRRAKIRPDEPGRGKILEAARAVFAERGYEASSIAEIGVRGGISKSVLYHYFGSKADLYRAILEEEGRALVDAVAAVVPGPDVDAPRLRPGVEAFLRYLRSHPDTWKLTTREPPLDPELRRLHRQVDASVADALRYLLAPAEKRETRPDLVDLIATAIRAYVTWWQRHPEVPVAELVDAIGDFAATSTRRLSTPDAVVKRA